MRLYGRRFGGILFMSIVLMLLVGMCSASGIAFIKPKPLDCGIKGYVKISPIYPVERPGVKNEGPYQATIVVKSINNKREIKRFSSDQNGWFKVTLPPGFYKLVPLPPSGSRYPSASPQNVNVCPGKYSDVEIYYNSGIR